MIRRRAEIVALLLCLLSGPTTSTNLAVRRRWRALEGYYNFDEDGDGDGSEGNPVDMPSTDDVDGIDVDAKGSKAHKAIVSSPVANDKSAAEGSDRFNSGGSDRRSGDASGSYSGASDSYRSGSGSSSYSGASGSYSSGKESGSYSGVSGSYSGASGSYSGVSDSYSGASGTYSGASGSYSSGKGSSTYRGADSPSTLSSDFESLMSKVNVDVPLLPAIIVASIFMCCGMLCTAFMYQARPESTFTNCCRLSIHCIRSVCAIALNLYHCRLGEIPPIVCAMEDADDLDDEELERMQPRPGIQKALHIEHQKALSRVEFASNPANKTGQPIMAKVFG